MAGTAASTMTSSSLAAVLLCTAAAFFAAAHAKSTDDGHHRIHGKDLVAETCGNVMSHDWGWFLHDKFCESTLRLDKRRSAAARHPRDLALVAMDLAQRAVADADARVDGTLRSGRRHSNDTALLLRHCRLDYATVASTIPVCRAMVEDYKLGAKREQQLAPEDHLECARRLRRGTFSCWIGLISGDRDFSKLVLEDVSEACRRTDLVAAMLEEMLGIVINDHDPTLWF